MENIENYNSYNQGLEKAIDIIREELGINKIINSVILKIKSERIYEA